MEMVLLLLLLFLILFLLSLVHMQRGIVQQYAKIATPEPTGSNLWHRLQHRQRRRPPPQSQLELQRKLMASEIARKTD
uniref:Secreted protein n=1 Tax=Physcomitrium patens TaxID=3218 RepID=A0A2K1JMA2_PHYPA|nr:hypothetical protein PHYPA_017493 [Physcomitrium patens]